MDSAPENPKEFREMCVRLLRQAYNGEQREPRVVRTFRLASQGDAKAETEPTCRPIPGVRLD
jgi:hypothetical protein